MPNWCNNIVTIEHKNKTAIDRVEKAFKKGTLCSEFIPTPEDLKNTSAPNNTNAEEMKQKYNYRDWYEFQVNEWGTKWDVGGEDQIADRINRKRLELTFESAWAPPVGLYNKLREEGYDVHAYYYEPGAGYAGLYSSENGDKEYTIPETSHEARRDLPENLDEMFHISEGMRLDEEDLENLMGGEE
jgi:hypothetical protein